MKKVLIGILLVLILLTLLTESSLGGGDSNLVFVRDCKVLSSTDESVLMNPARGCIVSAEVWGGYLHFTEWFAVPAGVLEISPAYPLVKDDGGEIYVGAEGVGAPKSRLIFPLK